jgi:hypothetical protein
MSIQRIAKSELPSFIKLLSLAYNIKTKEEADKEMKQWAKNLWMLASNYMDTT